ETCAERVLHLRTGSGIPAMRGGTSSARSTAPLGLQVHRYSVAVRILERMRGSYGHGLRGLGCRAPGWHSFPEGTHGHSNDQHARVPSGPRFGRWTKSHKKFVSTAWRRVPAGKSLP